MFEIARSDVDAVNRVRSRLQNDLLPLLVTAQGMQAQAPFWAIARTLFPIAESLAWLLDGGEIPGTSARLSWFFREVLSRDNPGYRDLASIICQVWRHGLTHGDEPPLLVIDCPVDANGVRNFEAGKSMSWKLALVGKDHLEVLRAPLRRGTPQEGRFTFCLVHFYDELIAVTDDAALWKGIAEGLVKDRYNHWAVKYLDDENGAEPKEAAEELRRLLS